MSVSRWLIQQHTVISDCLLYLITPWTQQQDWSWASHSLMLNQRGNLDNNSAWQGNKTGQPGLQRFVKLYHQDGNCVSWKKYIDLCCSFYTIFMKYWIRLFNLLHQIFLKVTYAFITSRLGYCNALSILESVVGSTSTVFFPNQI